MATTFSMTITITDSANAPLTDIRDSLAVNSLVPLNITIGGYQGSPSDNAAKLAFIKTQILNFITLSYQTMKSNQQMAINVENDLTALSNVNNLASQIQLS